MRFVSKFALAAVLSTGLAGFAAVQPAIAQQKPGAAPVIKTSDAARKFLAAAQDALKKGDTATAEAQLAEAEKVASTDGDRYFVASLRLPIIAKTNDRARLIPVLDALIASPITPQVDRARMNYFRGAFAFEARRYAEALPYLKSARDLGYPDANLQLQIGQSMIESGDLTGGVAEIDRAIENETKAGRKAPGDWYQYVIGQLYKGKQAEPLKLWLMKSIVAYPTPQNWRQALLVYRDSLEKSATKPDRPLMLDLFRLLRITKSMADRGDYLEYADTAYYAGLAGEAKSVLLEGRSTGKLPATDPGISRLLADAETAIKSEGSLAGVEARAKAAPTGKPAAQTGDAYLAFNQYPKAIELYRYALQKGGADPATVNLHLGIALANSNQNAEAKTAFEAVTAGPRKDLAEFWLQYLALGVSAPTPAAAAPAAAQPAK